MSLLAASEYVTSVETINGEIYHLQGRKGNLLTTGVRYQYQCYRLLPGETEPTVLSPEGICTYPESFEEIRRDSPVGTKFFWSHQFIPISAIAHVTLDRNIQFVYEKKEDEKWVAWVDVIARNQRRRENESTRGGNLPWESEDI